MKDSTVLWLVLLQAAVFVAVGFVGVFVSSRLACLLFGFLGAVQFFFGKREGRIPFLPVIGRTTVDQWRHPHIFIAASVSHLLLTLSLIVLPILSWLEVVRVGFLK